MTRSHARPAGGTGSKPMVHVWRTALCLLAATWSASLASEYESIEVSIPVDSVQLAGTIYVPRSTTDVASRRPVDSRRPGVVVLHGSGTTDRVEVRHVGFLDCLLDAGLVVLDFDKRGIGGSGGTSTDAPILADRAMDGAAAVRFLRARPEVDPARVGIWGISQGGWVGGGCRRA